jgi:hypothetical protein
MFDAEKFNPNEILCSLKDFQKRSSHNAFMRLYKSKDSTSRFLIADEVGLGKTVICRGLIALAIEEIAKTEDFKQDRNNIDIIYICSNQDIASQNIRKLNFVNEDESFASRITLIPEIYSQKELGRVRFVSFTPDTSFNVRRGTGVRRERALLYYFLYDAWDMRSARAKSLYFFRGGASGARWEQYVQKNCEYWDGMDLTEFSSGFQEALVEFPHLKEQFLKLRDSYPQHNSNPSDEIRSETNKVIGELRKILAQVCLHKMSPDLVIMDEFQRFKDLFDENTDVGELAKYLFNYPDVKTVLLSATPYKMYTIGDDDEENHYDDFLSTTSWLLNDNQELIDKLKTNLEKFRSSVFTKSGVNVEKALEGKLKTEEVLRLVMSRTERVKSTKENDGMIRNNELEIIPTPEEMISFVQLEEIAGALDLKGNVDYWKSSPYLLNLMENYDIKRRLLDRLHTVPVKKVMAKYPSAFIDKKAIEDYDYISPNNSRLKAIEESIFKDESWKLLWVPPTAPYYKLRGVFDKFSDRSFTKSLVFSSWKVVPRAVASLISHEAESKSYLNGPYNDKGVDTYKKRRLLTIGKEGDELKGLRTLILLYPSLSLVELGDIFSLNLHSLIEIDDILDIVKDKIKPLLNTLVERYKKKDDRDENWYWAAPLLLDRESENKDVVASWFHGKYRCGWYENDSQDVTQNIFADHVDRYKEVFYGDIELGSPPEDLLEKLAIIALASPANVIYRSFQNIHKDKTNLDELNKLILLFHSSSCAFSMRSLFDSSEAISIIRNIEDDSYWSGVLNYCLDGNLQSVCDEYIHILKLNKSKGFQKGLKVFHEDEDPFEDIAGAFQDVCSMRKAPMSIDIFEENENKPTKVRTRCKFALEYGKWKSEEDNTKTRAETVRDAFNSPFRPFVLATTSVGQEGLDFHQYCHSIFHWNLPRNPVDLEQREGRIHRFKGHVIRKNVATEFNILKYKDGDVWDELFQEASDTHKGEFSDMVPYWIFDSEFKVERNVPIIPYSKDDQHFQSLLKTLARYRLAFGQPRQDELLKVLDENEDFQLEGESLDQMMIDLSPPEMMDEGK